MKLFIINAIRLAIIFSGLFITGINNLHAQTCNQVEILYNAPDCLQEHQANPGGFGGSSCIRIGVCVDQPYTYSSSITASGWTFNWTVAGPSTVTINPNNTSPTVTISWPQVGVYTLTLTATDPSGNVFTYCLKVDVKDKPVANFSFSPNNVCAGSTIAFTNLTTYSGSGVAYSWNFGDPSSGSNNFSTATDPTHTYNSAGTYNVTLIAYSFTTSGGSSPNDPPSIKTCCADTITKQVIIRPGNIRIDCISTVCAGDTVKYTVSGCGSPTFLPPVGGTILSQAGNSVTIIWGNGNPQGQILVQCPGSCTASFPIPIIPTTPIIVGNTSPCLNSTTSYSLPLLPGTFYTWTLTNITTSTNHTNLISTYPDNNTAWINWSAAPPGTYQLSINLENKHICCSSNGSLIINPADSWKAFFDQTICAGSPASLSVFPLPGTFSWTVLPPNAGVSPLTGTGPSFAPIFNNAGIYTVQVVETANTYCNSGASNPQQITVTVVSTPAPGTINGPVTVCPGTQYTYSMSSSAPTGYHYTWTITNGTFEPGSQTTVTGNSANVVWSSLPGTISVVLERNTNPPCPSAAVTLTANQGNPGTVTGPTSVCVDAIVNYTLTGSTLPSGEPVNWTITPGSLGTIISGQGTSSINVLWHGQATSGPWGPATISASTACGNATALGGIMIFPKFTFSITKTGTDLCQPGGVNLTVTGEPGGSTYLWSPGGQTTSSINVSAPANPPGTYSVTVTNGGCSITKSFTVQDPLQVVPMTCGVGTCDASGNTNEQLGVTVLSPTSGTVTFQWYNGITNAPYLGATNNTFLTPSHGPFYVIVTYGNCQKTITFNVNKVCCPNTYNPQITVVNRTGCNSFSFTGTSNPGPAPITWNFGDGNTAPGISGVPINHTYANAGIYCVTYCVGPPSPNPSNCTGNCSARTVIVPLQASFNYSLGCNGCITVNNTSTVIPINNPTVTYNWNFGDGFTSTAQNPSSHCYTIPGTYTVTLTITYVDGALTCTSTASHTVTYAPLSFTINPTPVCAGSPSTFTAPPGFVSYAWDFGDLFTAYTATTTHIYSSTGTFNVTLTVVDIFGTTCTATTTVTVLPGIGPCTIQPGYICPGGTATLTAPSFVGATYLWEYGTSPNSLSPAPGTNNNVTYTATAPGFYHVIITGPNGCKCISNTVEVKSVPKPKAIIAASPGTKLCGPGTVMLTSTNHVSGHSSDWYDASFNLLSSGQMYFATISSTSIINLVLTNEYGCKDTCSITITVNPIPAPPIITASPTLCEGVPITLTVTNYGSNITWNTGASGSSTTVFAAGTYTATFTHPVTGCKSSTSIKVNRRPPTDLFPHFCDKIPCNCRDENGNFTIYAPRPLIGMFASNYNIQWYHNNNPVGSNGPNPFFTPAQAGTYFIVVTDPLTGCKDTSNKYTISFLECCDCEKSKWGDIILSPTVDPPAQSLTEANVPGSQKLNCNKTYTLNCNQSYTINASFNCKDVCTSKVTYNLQPPLGAPLTGNVPLTFTPVLTGVYTLTLYGWCDGKICDSCIIKFVVECPRDCCPYNVRVETGNPSYSYNSTYNATIASINLSVFGVAGVPLNEVRAEVLSYTINDNYNKECMKCQNFPYTWASMLSATNIGTPAAGPKITMFNSTVHPFVPTGTGIYKNPREVIWSNGSTFMLPNNSPIGLSLILPPPPLIDCCELKGKICIKLTFRNDKCKECEVIVCFDFHIKSRKPTGN